MSKAFVHSVPREILSSQFQPYFHTIPQESQPSHNSNHPIQTKQHHNSNHNPNHITKPTSSTITKDQTFESLVDNLIEDWKDPSTSNPNKRKRLIR